MRRLAHGYRLLGFRLVTEFAADRGIQQYHPTQSASVLWAVCTSAAQLTSSHSSVNIVSNDFAGVLRNPLVS